VRRFRIAQNWGYNKAGELGRETYFKRALPMSLSRDRVGGEAERSGAERCRDLFGWRWWSHGCRCDAIRGQRARFNQLPGMRGMLGWVKDWVLWLSMDESSGRWEPLRVDGS